MYKQFFMYNLPMINIKLQNHKLKKIEEQNTKKQQQIHMEFKAQQ